MKSGVELFKVRQAPSIDVIESASVFWERVPILFHESVGRGSDKVGNFKFFCDTFCELSFACA